MLTIIIPIQQSDLWVTPECIKKIHAQTFDLSAQIVFFLDGFSRVLFNPIEAELDEVSWDLDHSAKKVYLCNALEQLFQRAKELGYPSVFLLPPWVVLEDPKWFAKLNQLMSLDPLCGMVAVDEESGGTPSKLNHKNLPDEMGPVMFRLKALEDMEPFAPFEKNPIEALARQMLAKGLTVWSHPSVRWDYFDHEEHSPCRDTSVLTTPFE